MKAVLIIIGDEILAGNTIDTNSNFIAKQLRDIGIPVIQVFTVADDSEIIENTLKSAFELGDLVISTGGLGPTKDDKTKIAFAHFFDDHLQLDEFTFEHLRNLFQKRNREHLLEINRDQAVVLSKARIFQNDHGSAPCQMIEQNGKIAICLPGVPYEVKPLVKNKIIPFLQTRFSLNHIIYRMISVVGIPESSLALTIEKWELALPENLSLSYSPIGNRVKLRLTAVGMNKDKLENQLTEEVEKLKPLIGENVISWKGDEIEEILKEILLEKELTISTAESCTGGELARLITSVPGLSSFYLGGVIPYEIDKKVKILNVSENTLYEKTVVSAEVAQEMSSGCQKLFATDIALSTTGVSGPDSDEFGNEVGTVFYSIRVKDFEISNRLFYPHLERNDFANFVSQRILQDLT